MAQEMDDWLTSLLRKEGQLRQQTLKNRRDTERSRLREVQRSLLQKDRLLENKQIDLKHWHKTLQTKEKTLIEHRKRLADLHKELDPASRQKKKNEMLQQVLKSAEKRLHRKISKFQKREKQLQEKNALHNADLNKREKQLEQKISAFQKREKQLQDKNILRKNQLQQREKRLTTRQRGEIELPDYLMDPITYGIFKDPVVGDDGWTYDRETIDRMMATRQPSAVTGRPLRRFVPNVYLRKALQAFQQEWQELDENRNLYRRRH